MAVEFHLKFAVVDAARDRLHASPFVPFRLRLHDGAVVEIAHPDMLSVTKTGAIVHDDGQLTRTFNPALIAVVEHATVHA